jgi:nucleoside 2-deoxyribosyltransferase
MICHFCNYDVTTFQGKKYGASTTAYHCPICGEVRVNHDAVDEIEMQRFSEQRRHVLSIVFRNDYEKRGKKPANQPLTPDDLRRLVTNYRPLDALEKLDQALLIFDRMSEKKVGRQIAIDLNFDYALFHCESKDELNSVLFYLTNEGYLQTWETIADKKEYWISTRGLERLRKIKDIVSSNNCFVAMWFTSEMQIVFEKAVKPAIEFFEEGQTEPQFKAIKIDNVEHINDINDEIIATIRRSRFMVCDLTGYRGGVYFEAGFAHGLGIPVIYTCRDDWCYEDKLRDDQDRVIETLKDSTGRAIRVRKEGVHFDLAHRNRIPWSDDKLDEFRMALENRIKAVIV